jgi:2-keto-4-pentenoate hydratase/2-oxohepta-3-ene-1,7-dioic acid hydratase in catechol pathway
MKLLRYGPVGKEKPALIDDSGRIRDLSEHLIDLDASSLDPDRLAALGKLNTNNLPIVEGTNRIGTPVTNIGKIVAIGLNYSDHAKETNLPIPDEPIIFSKATTSLSGPNDNIILPRNSEKGDWEVELAIIIGSKAQYVSEDNAIGYIAGYTVANDVSERGFQMQCSQWDKGKGFDTSCPLGPWLVTSDEISDPQNLRIWLELNGERVQDGNTKTMIFSCAHIVSYVSNYMTLMPGDVIVTGTPPGVGMGFTPPQFLKAGDHMRLGIEGLGEQSQRVNAYIA